jgi:cytochrome b involved in lipid metabolism
MRFVHICQVRRHNHAESCWLVAGDTIYDATNYVAIHPGGTDSILRKAGGATDCTRDMQFHSKASKQMWKKYKVGQLRPCACLGGNSESEEDSGWWMFWAR